jgi:hypothetical protein
LEGDEKMLFFSQANKSVRNGGNRKARFVKTGPEYGKIPVQEPPSI